MGIEDRLTLRKAQITGRICAERDENGKKKYSNEIERDAAIDEALLTDEEYQEIRRSYASTMTEIRALRLALES